MPIWYGGDYNPEQWPESVWSEDVQLMQVGNVNMATVGVFSWSKLEPREGEFDFDWLDRVLDLLHENGVRVDLATATASPPPWLATKYPEILPVTESGTVLSSGSRQAYCPSSPVYREHAARLARKIAYRYRDHPSLQMWHINNEYGCHVSHCYCDVSAAAFRAWLVRKYSVIGDLNATWGTSFWSQQYSSFDEVLPPRAAPYLRNPSQVLDFDRFSSDEVLACYRIEADIVRSIAPGVPVTTNFMGFFKSADYWQWAREVDVVSDDSYADPADPASPAWSSMSRDLMRSLGGGAPWILMEQATSAVNWRRANAPKRPGQMRAWSYQALARGADGILFFQWRQSVVGGEQYHSGMLPHSGTDTRTWREVQALGAELSHLSASTGEERLLGQHVDSHVAIVFDWTSWWALEQAGRPTTLTYMDEVFAWHREFTSRGLVVDFAPPSADLTAYHLVIVPTLLAATDADLDNLHHYAASGGTLLVTYQTAVTDENLRIRTGGYLGKLQQTLGIWIEEFAPLAGPDLANTGRAPRPVLSVSGASFQECEGDVWSEFVRLKGADVFATFSGDLDGWPAITSHTVDSGEAWYVATSLDTAGRSSLAERLLEAAGFDLEHVATLPSGVEVVTRGHVTVAINHGLEQRLLHLRGRDLLTGADVDQVVLDSQDVALVVRDRAFGVESPARKPDRQSEEWIEAFPELVVLSPHTTKGN